MIIAQRFSLLFVAYFICRLFFLLWNWTLFSQTPVDQIALSFLIGLRFDLAAIIFVNAILLPVWLLPSHLLTRKWVSRLERGAFGFLNGIAFGFNIIDAEFVKFIGKRTSYDLLLMGDDLQRHSLSVMLTYWPFLLGWLALSLSVYFLAKPFAETNESWRSPRFWFWRAVLVGLAVIGGRGGFQFKPLHPMHAYFSTRHEIGLLTLNTPLIYQKPTTRRGATGTLF